MVIGPARCRSALDDLSPGRTAIAKRIGGWTGFSNRAVPTTTSGASARDTSASVTSTTASGVRAILSRYATVPVTLADGPSPGATSPSRRSRRSTGWASASRWASRHAWSTSSSSFAPLMGRPAPSYAGRIRTATRIRLTKIQLIHNQFHLQTATENLQFARDETTRPDSPRLPKGDRSIDREEMHMKKYGAEFFGTFWLVLGGCGSAVLAAAFPERGHRAARRLAGLRPHGAHHGLRHRAHLRLPPQPGRVGGPVGRRPLPGEPAPAVHHRAGARRARRGRRPVRHRQRHGGLRRLGAASPPTATAPTRPAATRCWPPWSARSS